VHQVGNYCIVLFTVDPLFNISQSYRPLPFTFTLPLLPLPSPVLFVPVTSDLFLYRFVQFVTASCCPLKPLQQSRDCVHPPPLLHSDTPLYAHSPLTRLTIITASYFPMDYLQFALFCTEVFRNQYNEVADATKGSCM